MWDWVALAGGIFETFAIKDLMPAPVDNHPATLQSFGSNWEMDCLLRIMGACFPILQRCPEGRGRYQVSP